MVIPHGARLHGLNAVERRPRLVETHDLLDVVWHDAIVLPVHLCVPLQRFRVVLNVEVDKVPQHDLEELRALILELLHDLAQVASRTFLLRLRALELLFGHRGLLALLVGRRLGLVAQVLGLAAVFVQARLRSLAAPPEWHELRRNAIELPDLLRLLLAELLDRVGQRLERLPRRGVLLLVATVEAIELLAQILCR